MNKGVDSSPKDPKGSDIDIMALQQHSYIAELPRPYFEQCLCQMPTQNNSPTTSTITSTERKSRLDVSIIDYILILTINSYSYFSTNARSSSSSSSRYWKDRKAHLRHRLWAELGSVWPITTSHPTTDFHGVISSTSTEPKDGRASIAMLQKCIFNSSVGM